MNYSTIAILASLCVASIAKAETITTTQWQVVEDRSVIGTLGDVFVAAAASERSPFGDISSGRFTGENWQAGMDLPSTAMSVSAFDANEGDSHVFIFSEAMSQVRLYIENFDSSSIAEVSLLGTGTLRLLSESPSISFVETSPTSGKLTTSNATSNGEGDLVVELTGEIQSLAIDYVAGDGANGIFYTLAVSEPSGTWAFPLGFATLLCGLRRSSRRRMCTDDRSRG